ncbi:MAG TPA: alpha/beta hydrolase [Candidatus Lokiarchaeia archaeon]|nr:alpha/beta hydrolase [Candidatus Lokiarchaeia archaeon]
MEKVISNDGTEIAYKKMGEGPAIILIDGAMGSRSLGRSRELAILLAPAFTVYYYDRRGRGDSGDTEPYAVEREVEDIEALIDEAGGSAYLSGESSGACLALEAAMKLGDKVKKLAMYEAPYDSNEDTVQDWIDYTMQLEALLGEGRPGDAAALFMRFVGTPEPYIEQMRNAPIWPTFETVAPTLAYDASVMGDKRSVPIDRAAVVTASTLVMDGGESLASMPFMSSTAQALAEAIPNAQHHTLEGQGHAVDVNVLAQVLMEFFSDSG